MKDFLAQSGITIDDDVVEVETTETGDEILVISVSGLAPGAVDRANAEWAMDATFTTTTTGGVNVLEVNVNSDLNPDELEVDHSLEGTLPEFSVYADEENPYGTDADKEQFEALGVIVDYANGTWTITLPEPITVGESTEISTLNMTFYLKLIDVYGNEFGSMNNGGYLTVPPEPADE
jgi:hypothetical protein